MTRPSASDIERKSAKNRAAHRGDGMARVAPPGVWGPAIARALGAGKAQVAKNSTETRQRDPGSSLTLELPYPPSKNALDVRRIAVSKAGKRYSARSDSVAYRNYKAGIRLDVWKQRGSFNGCILGELAIDITLYPPDRRRRDLLNPLEALCDALTHAGVWFDDNQIVRAAVRRGIVCEGGKCVIRIEEA